MSSCYRIPEKLIQLENEQKVAIEKWKMVYDKKYLGFSILEGNLQETSDMTRIDDVVEWIENLKVYLFENLLEIGVLILHTFSIISLDENRKTGVNL